MVVCVRLCAGMGCNEMHWGGSQGSKIDEISHPEYREVICENRFIPCREFIE